MQVKRYVEPYGVFGAMVGDVDQPRAQFVVQLTGAGAQLDKGGQRATYYDGEECTVSTVDGYNVTSLQIEGGSTITELPYTFIVTRTTRITVTAQPAIPEPVAFATDSWATIASAAESGNAQQYYNVGDEKTIQLSTGEQVTLVILGFNHDDLISGGKAAMTIGMKELLATEYRMNATRTNVGSWNKCEMRTLRMPALLAQLPSDLQDVIKQVNKKTTAGNTSTSITTSTDKLWLLAKVEVDGTTDRGYVDEGQQYEYWKTVKDGTVDADRIKRSSNGNGSVQDWWLRSPRTTTDDCYEEFNKSGGDSSSVADIFPSGVSYAFCI